jgi:preprotein translocase subunit SecY
MSKGLVDPSGWGDLVEKIGLGGAVILIFALGVAFNLHKIINALNGFLKTMLKHQREKKRIPIKIKEKQKNLKNAISAAKRNDKK